MVPRGARRINAAGRPPEAGTCPSKPCVQLREETVEGDHLDAVLEAQRAFAQIDFPTPRMPKRKKLDSGGLSLLS